MVSQEEASCHWLSHLNTGVLLAALLQAKPSSLSNNHATELRDAAHKESPRVYLEGQLTDHLTG